jgi:hypothetical protein
MSVKSFWIYSVICIIIIFAVVACTTAPPPPITSARGEKELIERIGDIEIWKITIDSNMRICYLLVSPTNTDLECL